MYFMCVNLIAIDDCYVATGHVLARTHAQSCACQDSCKCMNVTIVLAIIHLAIQELILTVIQYSLLWSQD